MFSDPYQIFVGFMNDRDLGVLRSNGLDAEIRRNKSVSSVPPSTPSSYHPGLTSPSTTSRPPPNPRSSSKSKSGKQKLNRKGKEDEFKALLASQQQFANYYSAGIVSPQAAAFQLYAAQLQKGFDGFNMAKMMGAGGSGELVPPYMPHPQILEQIEVQRRLAMISQHHHKLKDHKGPKGQQHITLKSSGAGGASAFRPVQPKDKSKSDRLKKSSGPPRSSSVPALKSDEVKSFPFSWDRKAPGSDDACSRPSLNGPISGAPAPGMKVENPANESSSSTDGLKSDAVTAAANRGALAAWQNHVKKMTPAKKRLFMMENSDSSIPQSPLSCSPVMHQHISPAKRDAEKGGEVTNVITTPLTTESDCEIIKPNETDDEKLKKIVTTIDSPDNTKIEPTKIEPTKIEPTKNDDQKSPKKNTSPLPIKKRRLHAVIADALNQSVQSDASTSTASSRNMSPVGNATAVTNSSSDSDIPLAIIRQKLQKAKQEQITPAPTPPVKSSPSSRSESPSNDVPKIKIRKQDFLTDASLEASLKTFKRNVVTPDVTSSSGSSDEDDEQDGAQTRARTGTPPARPRVKRSASSISSGSTALDARELQQLAPFMLSSSEDDEDQSESESDDEYRSRAHFDSDVERRQTRSPGGVIKQKSPKSRSPKSDKKPEKKKTVKRSLENVLKRVSDLKKTKPGENMTNSSLLRLPKRSRKQSNAALEKFFAAEKEMDETFRSTKSDKPAKRSENKSPKIKCEPRKRKSNTPRKLEILTPEDNWEHSEQTVVDKNSSAGQDYLINENDDSWYSVTCFCGGPFAGRPMIECHKCDIWVHMTCGKIKKNKVPEKYICPKCRRDTTAVPTRSTPARKRPK